MFQLVDNRFCHPVLVVHDSIEVMRLYKMSSIFSHEEIFSLTVLRICGKKGCLELCDYEIQLCTQFKILLKSWKWSFLVTSVKKLATMFNVWNIHVLHICVVITVSYTCYNTLLKTETCYNKLVMHVIFFLML